jgi:hypothetical protein
VADHPPAASDRRGASLVELGPDNEAQLAHLRRALSDAGQFQVVLLEVPEHPIRRVVIDRVLAWSAAGRIPPLRRLAFDPAAPDEGQIVERIMAAPTGCIVEGLDSVLVSDAVFDRALGTLNWYRERLRALDGPLLLVLSPRGVAALMARAPDFATWRSHTCRIAVPRSHASPARLEALLDPRPDPLDLDVAEAALAAARHKGSPRDRLAGLWLGVARARARANDRTGHDDALAAAEELISAGIEDPGAAATLAAMMIDDDIEQGHLAKARERLAVFDHFFEAEVPTFIKARVALIRAQLAFTEQAWPEAADHARLAARLADEADQRSLRFAARQVLIASAWHFGDPSSLRPLAEELVAIATTIPEIARALTMLAVIEAARGRLDLAVDALKRALGMVGTGSGHAAERTDIMAHLAQTAVLAAGTTPTASSSELMAAVALASEAAALA